MIAEIVLTREARKDVAHAIFGYGEISSRLSARFGEELEHVFNNISSFPDMYPLVYRNFRRALLRKFPYSVFYVVEESFVLVVAVVHQARDESAWKRRS
ncbi:MAG TPA: type II toxin-antitoxin system RelE/ParE family toxin [Thermoanaerobaculia bacterium]|nr:type II toxin-antitoxin system RelE/ParE family toxin [Thermoanaerobaculia bacterium]